MPLLQGEQRFSEMALYVPVCRSGDCWLARVRRAIVVACRAVAHDRVQ
jgi:hypothetical protein